MQHGPGAGGDQGGSFGSCRRNRVCLGDPEGDGGRVCRDGSYCALVVVEKVFRLGD